MSQPKDRPADEYDDEMHPEYDLQGKQGVRGKYWRAYREGYSLTIENADGTQTVQHFQPHPGSVILEPDVQEYFPDSDSVNHALRSLIALIPKRKAAKKVAAPRKRKKLHL